VSFVVQVVAEVAEANGAEMIIKDALKGLEPSAAAALVSFAYQEN